MKRLEFKIKINHLVVMDNKLIIWVCKKRICKFEAPIDLWIWYDDEIIDSERNKRKRRMFWNPSLQFVRCSCYNDMESDITPNWDCESLLTIFALTRCLISVTRTDLMEIKDDSVMYKPRH